MPDTATGTLDRPLIGDNQPPLADALRQDHADLIQRRDDLIAAFDRTPESVDDEETAGKVQDFVKQIDAAVKRSEALRKDRKEPYLEGGRQVDGFFKGVSDPLAKASKSLKDRITVFLRRKADAERRAREEAERKAREEAERAAKEAAERAEALANETDLAEAIEAEDEAIAAAEAARKAEKEAAAKAADLSRTRGEYGAVGSLRTTWAFEVLDIHELDLEAIRAHLPIQAVEQAIRSFVKAGGRELKGVRIFEETNAVVR